MKPFAGDGARSDNAPKSVRGAFLAWLDEARPRLAVSVNIECSARDGIEFSFEVANPVLHGWVADHGEIAVSADWADECWTYCWTWT